MRSFFLLLALSLLPLQARADLLGAMERSEAQCVPGQIGPCIIGVRAAPIQACASAPERLEWPFLILEVEVLPTSPDRPRSARASLSEPIELLDNAIGFATADEVLVGHFKTYQLHAASDSAGLAGTMMTLALPLQDPIGRAYLALEKGIAPTEIANRLGENGADAVAMAEKIREQASTMLVPIGCPEIWVSIDKIDLGASGT